MISESRKCSACGGVEFHHLPEQPWQSDCWKCERCGRIQNHRGEILVQGNPAARRNV